ncbi:putative E3 ubiquitin-protein ligase MARCH1 [Daphnia magna]|uniref:E3 ubiquitin-protein ligase MARCH3 n=1 Tax=Daphnia magna TaxID=35525 RepID=A0A0P6CS69_9CRUS|nr:putative E3 ubiquitin-protein ligase MARCH1 [Daphnia magna]
MNNSRQFGGSPFSNNNSEIMCRICHEGESKEELFSFCKCSGTVAMAHRSCLEKWLSTANSSACEICKFNFQTSRRPRPILDWFRNTDSSQDTNNLIGDLVCFIVLSPLTIVSCYLCVVGASHYMVKRGVSWEASGLIVLSVILATVYCVWLGATVRHHVRTMKKWQESHQSVELISVRNTIINLEENNNDSTNNSMRTDLQSI